MNTRTERAGLKPKIRFHFLIISALALCVCSLPAKSSTVLFSDLGPSTAPYDLTFGDYEAGSANPLGTPGLLADQFIVAGVGNFSVSEIDLALANLGACCTNGFSASIWTDVAGAVGTQVTGADWSGMVGVPACCATDLTPITGITAVTLSGGQAYFLVLGPLSPTDFVIWNANNQGVTGDVQFLGLGGLTSDFGENSTLEAFEILGNSETANTPEPRLMPLLLFGIGFAGTLVYYRRKSQRSQ
jgi:hypothetical protein